MSDVRVVVHEDQIRKMYADSSAPILRWLTRVAFEIEGLARAMAPADVGHLRNSITHEFRIEGNLIFLRVGSNLPYALYVEKGTGIYGPLGRRIYPRSAKALRWGNRGMTRPAGPSGFGASRSLQPTSFTFAKSVAGMKPRPFLATALQRAHLT